MKKTLSLILVNLSVFGLLVLMAPAAYGGVEIDPGLRPDYSPQGRVELQNPDATADEKYGVRSVSFIIADFTVVLLQVAGSVAIFFIASNGFKYIRAFGQEEQIQAAKKGLIWAIVGLVIVIFSYAIVETVFRITLTVDESQLSNNILGTLGL